MLKTKIMLAVAAFLATGAVFAQNGASLGVVGVTRVTKPAGLLNMLGNNFASMTLNEFAPPENYNGHIIAGLADCIYIWNPVGQAYTVCGLYDDRAYLGESGTVEWRDVNDFNGSAIDPVIPAGSSMWLFALGTDVETDAYISGDVIDSQTVTNQVSAGLQQMCYPFSSDVDLNDTSLAGVATGSIVAGLADRIYVWDVDAQTYRPYALYDDRFYLGPSGSCEWRDINMFNTPAEEIPVNMGQGFWYDAISGFSWVETNAYFSSL
ncbi:MAG: hypothetical protein JXR25_03525 [Pontiellaceae bacterium]|nr:hypothetical protein [Pontiellaceae bacterium]MBN2783872.1 hypothetical protein [Pontiellaceae bacterium]